MEATVEVIRDGSSVRSIPIPYGSSLIFGRSPKCQVAIDDPSLSRRHLMVKYDESGLMVTDMRSSNGTFVNGIQVHSQHLKGGDLISLGYVILRVQTREGPPQSSKFCATCGKPVPIEYKEAECARCLKAKSADQWVKNYQLLRPLGEGPRGWVYLARNPDSTGNCALKVLKTRRMTEAEAAQVVPELRARFAVSTTGAVKVLEVDFWNGLVYIASEFIDGGSLQAYLKNHGKVEERQAICFMIDLLPAIGKAASRGQVHGSVQPSNILYDRRGWSFLSDFGQAVGCAQLVPNSIRENSYTAPELVLNPAQADTRCDIYSLGVTAYHAVSGRAELPTASESGMLGLRCSPQLAYIIQRATDPNPANRYPGAGEMLKSIFTLFPGSEARRDARQNV